MTAHGRNQRRLRLGALVALLALVAPNAVAEVPSVPAPTPAPTPQSPDRKVRPLPFVALPGFVDPPPGQGIRRYFTQQLSWVNCDKDQCATMIAPMDYADPNGQAIQIKLRRKPASSKPRLGVLLVNPGGPGIPGTTAVVAAKKQTQYDVVGWDVRGTGDSTPVRCSSQPLGPQPELDQLLDLDATPQTDEQFNQLIAGFSDLGDRCAAASGSWLTHLSTHNTVQDMNLIRAVLGEEKVSLLGFSYGTYLGAMFAHYFPNRVARMVLDSPVNITLDEGIPQALGFDRALDLFAQWEAKRGKLGPTKEAVIATLKNLLDDLETRPLPVKGRKLSQSLAVSGIFSRLYGAEKSWQQLEAAAVAAKKGDGTQLLALADAMNSRRDDGSFETDYVAFAAIMCADSGDRGTQASRQNWQHTQKLAPFFGYYFGPLSMCESWPVKPVPHVELDATTAPTILVIGSTGDSATPYEHAVWMAQKLGSARLLTFDGPGHCSYGAGNACIDAAVERYFVDGTLPAADTVCKPG